MMKHTRLIGCALALLALAALLPSTSSAVPVFARKYGFTCTMCHTAFPQLNDFGSRYRDNGYQLPGREGEERTVLEGPAPLAMRTSAGYTYTTFENVLDGEEVSQFQLNGLDLLSAGLLGAGIGYLAVYTPEIAAMRGTEGQTGSLEMASVVFSNLASPWLSLRVGRFEPAYVAASVKRRLTFSPYEIYEYAGGGIAFSETQSGIELSGRGGAFRYAAGYVDGAESNNADDGPGDAYARAAMVFGPGEGQTVGQRVGIVGYFGKARPMVLTPEDEDCRRSFQRFGVDVSLNFAQVHFAGQYLLGRDDREFWHFEEDADFSGGFAEVNYAPLVSLIGFARYDWVSGPEEIDTDITRITAGLRYYFVDQLAAHLEYSKWEKEWTVDSEEEFVAARLDFAF